MGEDFRALSPRVFEGLFLRWDFAPALCPDLARRALLTRIDLGSRLLARGPVKLQVVFIRRLDQTLTSKSLK